MGSDELDAVGSPRNIEEETHTVEVEFDLISGDLTIPISANQSFLYTEPEHIFIEAAREILGTIFASDLRNPSQAFTDFHQTNSPVEISNSLPQEEVDMDTPSHSMEIIESSTKEEEIPKNENQEAAIPENSSNEADISDDPEKAKEVEPMSCDEDKVSSSSFVMMEGEPEYKCVQNSSINDRVLDTDKTIQPDSSTNGLTNVTPTAENVGEATDQNKINVTKGITCAQDVRADKSAHLQIAVTSSENTVSDTKKPNNIDMDSMYNFNKIDACMMGIDEEGDGLNKTESDKSQNTTLDNQEIEKAEDKKDNLGNKENSCIENDPSALAATNQTTDNSEKQILEQIVTENACVKEQKIMHPNEELDIQSTQNQIEKDDKGSESSLQEKVSCPNPGDIKVNDAPPDLAMGVAGDEQEKKAVDLEEPSDDPNKATTKTEKQMQSKVIEISIGVYNESGPIKPNDSDEDKNLEPDTTENKSGGNQLQVQNVLNQQNDTKDEIHQQQEGNNEYQQGEKENTSSGSNENSENKATTNETTDHSPSSVCTSDIIPTTSNDNNFAPQSQDECEKYKDSNNQGEGKETEENSLSSGIGREGDICHSDVLTPELHAPSKDKDEALSVEHLPQDKDNNGDTLPHALEDNVADTSTASASSAPHTSELVTPTLPAGLKRKGSQRRPKQVADESSPAKRRSPRIPKYPARLEYHKKGEC